MMPPSGLLDEEVPWGFVIAMGLLLLLACLSLVMEPQSSCIASGKGKIGSIENFSGLSFTILSSSSDFTKLSPR